VLDEPTAHEAAQHALDHGPKRAVRLGEALLVHAQKLLEVLLDETEERGLPRPPRPVHPRTDLHANPPAGGRDRRESRTSPRCATGRRGGATTDREVERFTRGRHEHATPLETVELVRKLAQEFDDAQIARILNRQGRRSGLDLAFTKESVKSLRGKNQIPVAAKRRARDEREGPFTLDESARELGVSVATVQRWLGDGLLAGEQSVPSAPWSIVLTEGVRRRLTAGDAPAGWVGLDEAARRLGLTKSHLAHLVKQGKLNAVRATVGKRECWRIDVSSATGGRQADLLDQKTDDTRKES